MDTHELYMYYICIICDYYEKEMVTNQYLPMDVTHGDRGNTLNHVFPSDYPLISEVTF